MLALISSLFAALFSNSVAWFLALKGVLIVLMMTFLPIILRNFFTWIIQGMLDIVSASAIGAASPTVVTLTGLAGYLADGLGLPACFAVILSAVAVKFTLGLIPFLRI